jgi:hypothetical protein
LPPEGAATLAACSAYSGSGSIGRAHRLFNTGSGLKYLDARNEHSATLLNNNTSIHRCLNASPGRDRII